MWLDTSAPDISTYDAANSLLASLGPADQRLLAGRLHRIESEPGDLIFDAGEDVETAYFPLDGATIALSVGLADGRDVHAGLIGREGAVGGIVSGGYRPAFASGQVETGGPILTLSHRDLHRAKANSARLTDLFARYADCLFAQAMQTAACNAFHSAGQRIARWLLFLRDRIGREDIPISEERLGAIIGAHRITVVRAIKPLEEARIIEIRRSRIIVRDNAGLERIACECRHAIEQHYERMLPRWRLHPCAL
jgi:CRP-like cAMP-binding protein